MCRIVASFCREGVHDHRVGCVCCRARLQPGAGGGDPAEYRRHRCQRGDRCPQCDCHSGFDARDEAEACHRHGCHLQFSWTFGYIVVYGSRCAHHFQHGRLWGRRPSIAHRAHGGYGCHHRMGGRCLVVRHSHFAKPFAYCRAHRSGHRAAGRFRRHQRRGVDQSGVRHSAVHASRLFPRVVQFKDHRTAVRQHGSS